MERFFESKVRAEISPLPGKGNGSTDLGLGLGLLIQEYHSTCQVNINPAGEISLLLQFVNERFRQKKGLLEDLFNCLYRHILFTLGHISVVNISENIQ